MPVDAPVTIANGREAGMFVSSAANRSSNPRSIRVARSSNHRNRIFPPEFVSRQIHGTEIRDESADLARQERHSMRDGAGSRRSSTDAMPSSRSPPAPSAARTCICSTASCPRWKRATSSATRPWARSSRSAPKTRSSRSATASWFPSRSPAANASSARRASFRAASAPTPITRWPRSFGDIRRPACSAIRTCWAAMPAARPNISACPTPTSAPSRCRRASATSRSCFCRTSSRPASWPLISAI